MTSTCNPPTWDEVELSERFLVCCKFEDAAFLASSILQRLHEGFLSEMRDDLDLDDMRESTSMVFIQALKELGRTSEIFKELRELFGTLAAVPVQVVVTGSCFQMADGCIAALPSIIREFLDEWMYIEGTSFCVLTSSFSGGGGRSALHVDRYLEVVEIYAVTLLGTVLGAAEQAILWVKCTALPEDRRQKLLRVLHLLASSNLPLDPGDFQQVEITRPVSSLSKSSRVSGVEKSFGKSEARDLSSGSASKKTTFLSRYLLLVQQVTWRWWRFKAVSRTAHGRIVLWCSLILFVLYIMRRKGAFLMRIVRGQILSAREAVLDFWQLAFSVQVNPLAAVHDHPSPYLGNRL